MAKNKSTRRPKHEDPLAQARDLVAQGKVVFSRHALERASQRSINQNDVFYVIKTGYHERKKDEWKPEFKTWAYALRGRNIDGVDVRVAAAIEDDLVIVTVINLDLED